jgi:WD40 repeat protein
MTVVNQTLLESCWQTELKDYVTAIAWSATGKYVAAASAAGELMVWSTASWQVMLQFQTVQSTSIDGLAFSADDQFLAAGGQSGTVHIWQVQADEAETLKPVANLEHPRVWVDRLRWHPQRHELAFSLGHYAQVWDAKTQNVVATLHFEQSSVLDLAWQPQGQFLAVSGQNGVKAWNSQDWDAEPEARELATASVAIAWSRDGQYLATGNLDRTLVVWNWSSPYPWQMQGFPGKVRQLAWSDMTYKNNAPLLAAVSGEAIILWDKAEDEQLGWEATVLDLHSATVQAIGFQPNSLVLASAASDGWLCLWQRGQAMQILEGAPKGFSCVQWQPQGKMLAAGGQQGELLIWKMTSRGRGFGR